MNKKIFLSIITVCFILTGCVKDGMPQQIGQSSSAPTITARAASSELAVSSDSTISTSLISSEQLKSILTKYTTDQKEETNAQTLIIAVGPMGDKEPKTVNQGDTIEFVETYKDEYAEFPIIVDTASSKGISSERDSISIKCNTDWGIWEGTKPGGFSRSFHVNATKNKEAKFTIEKVLNNDNKNILSEPLVFYIKIKSID